MYTGELTVLVPRRWTFGGAYVALTTVLFAGGLASSIAGDRSEDTSGLATGIVGAGALFGFYGVLPGIWAHLHQRRDNAFAERRRGTVEVDDRGVRMNGAVLAERSAVHNGFVAPTEGAGDPLAVRLLGKDGEVVLEAVVPDDETGAKILSALRLGIDQRGAELRGPSAIVDAPARHFAVVMGGFLLFALGFAGFEAWPFFGAWLVAGVLLGLGVSPTRIRIGNDAITTRWLGLTRVHRYDDVAYIAKTPTGIALWSDRREIPAAQGCPVARGCPVDIHVGTDHREAEGTPHVRYRDALHARAHDAWTLHRSAREENHAAELLDPGKRAGDAWVLALRSLAVGAGDYRSCALTRDDLEAVLADPRRKENVRTAAAYLLLRDGADDARAKVRVAMEASASPALRRVLAELEVAPIEEVEERLARLRI